MNPINGFMHRTAHRHGIGQQCATCGTTERKRSRPAGVALLAVVVAVLGTLLFPAFAYAEEGGGGGGHSFEAPNVGIIFYGPSPALDSNANQVTEVGVTAYNEFDAAAYVLGYSYGEVRSWSSDIRAKLSNSETGGRFWEFAQTFTHTNNIDGVQWFIANVLYGVNLCWRSLYSDDLYRNALVDCQKVINGEDIGGGGSGGQFTGFPTTMTLTKGTHTQTFLNPQQYWFYSTTGKVYINFVSKLVENITASSAVNIPAGEYEIFAVSMQVNTTSVAGYFDVIVVPKGCAEVKDVDGRTGLYLTQRCVFYRQEVGVKPANAVHDGDTLRVDVNLTNMASNNQSAGYKIVGEGTDYRGYFFSSASGTTVVPPTNWPDEPEAPEPPELPEPGTNPTVDPTPWSPVIDLPDLSFDLNITSDPTSEDILDWVKKIYYELKAFHRDAQQWFTEISDSFEDVVSAINDMSSQIYAQLQRMDSNVSSEFQQTRTYLHRLFQWLANQLDFDNDPYNDSNVIYWLKQIWSKLGGGINTRPTDPTSDPENWWDWLIKAIQNFLIGLAATSSELISDFADVISQVMHQFPFSIPWDIAAFLAAFAAAPVTPEVTITIPAVEGWWASFDYHISMSAFDTAAAAIRAMEKILFAAFLAWKSRDLLDFMDVTKWFNG